MKYVVLPAGVYWLEEFKGKKYLTCAPQLEDGSFDTDDAVDVDPMFLPGGSEELADCRTALRVLGAPDTEKWKEQK